MDYDFLGNFEKFELMAFFSGYAIMYLLMNGVWRGDRLFGVSKARLLSYCYVLTATLFLGYTARKLFMGSVTDIQPHFYHPYLYIFGLLAILFWIPALNRRSFLMLVHSLVFFAMIPLDIISYSRDLIKREQVRNDMNILTISVILNVSTTFIAFLFLWLAERLRKRSTDVS